jgi:hypothetical protein
VEHGSEYVEQVHAAIRDTITGLLQHYLKEHPDLVKEAVAAAEQLLEEVVQPLKAAIKDVVLAHTYVVETLHNQVPYMVLLWGCSLRNNSNVPVWQCCMISSCWFNPPGG